MLILVVVKQVAPEWILPNKYIEAYRYTHIRRYRESTPPIGIRIDELVLASST